MWYLQRIVIVHFFERKIENDEPTVEVLSKKVTCLVLLPFFASKVRDFSFYNWAYSCLLPFLLLLTAVNDHILVPRRNNTLRLAFCIFNG